MRRRVMTWVGVGLAAGWLSGCATIHSERKTDERVLETRTERGAPTIARTRIDAGVDGRLLAVGAWHELECATEDVERVAFVDRTVRTTAPTGGFDPVPWKIGAGAAVAVMMTGGGVLLVSGVVDAARAGDTVHRAWEDERRHARNAVPCGRAPLAHAEVELVVRGQAIALGALDEQGLLEVDLTGGELGHWLEGEGYAPTAEVRVAGEPGQAVDLEPARVASAGEAWAGLGDTEDAGVLRAFAARFPGTEHARAAEARVRTLTAADEAAAWAEATEAGNAAAFDRFAAAYPESPRRGEAQRRALEALMAWHSRLESAYTAMMAPIRKFTVPEAAVDSPEDFEDVLRVEALLEVVSRAERTVGETLTLRHVQVRVVGLRAWLPDLSWARVLTRPSARAEA